MLPKLVSINNSNKLLNNKRIFGLDLLRAIAILLVLYNHGLIIYPYLPSSIGNYTFWISGFFGVEIFFVLSGFLIGRIFIKICENEQKLNFRIIIDFWKRRWFRTLPNYYFVLLIFIFLHYFEIFAFTRAGLEVFSQIATYFLFLQNLFEHNISIFIVSWSLSVEEWFYIILPLAMLFLNFIPKLNIRYKLYFVVLLIILSVCSYRTVAILKGVAVVHTVIYRLDAIMYGVGMAVIYFYHRSFWIRNIKNFSILALIIFLLNNFVIYKFILVATPNIYAKIILYPLTSLSFALLIPYFNSIKNSKNILAKIISNISIVSYSLYLNHTIIAFGILPFLKTNVFIFDVLLFIFYFVVCILISNLQYVFYEKPMTDLRDKL